MQAAWRNHHTQALPLAGAGLGVRREHQSSENAPVPELPSGAETEFDIHRGADEAGDMLRTLPPQVVRIAVDPSITAEIRGICSKGGRTFSSQHQAENGRKGGLKRCEPKEGRTPMRELWRHRWRKEEMAALRSEAIAPAAPHHPAIFCPAGCGWCVMPGNRIRDIISRGRSFDLECPRCGATMKGRGQKRPNLQNFYILKVEVLRR